MERDRPKHAEGGTARSCCLDDVAFSEQGKATKTILSVCRGALTQLWKGTVRSTKLYGGVAQLGEHLPCKQGVRSSILLISTSPKDVRRDCQKDSFCG